MVALITEALGKGIYTPQEAAFYARVPTQTLNRWLFGNKQGAPVVLPELGKTDDEHLVTFLDFIQALAIRDIRSKHKVPLPKIREAVDIAKEHGIDYPFAVKHKTLLYGDPEDEGRADVVLKVGDKLLLASGKSKRNFIIKEVAELYLRSLQFDPQSGLAYQYEPHPGVVMNPKLRFGEPFVESCGYTVETLWDAYVNEGGLKQAAEAYGVKEEDVLKALQYYDVLLGNTAA